MNLPLKQILFEEQTLHSRHAEFPARYIAVCNLHALAGSHPQSMEVDSLVNLEKLMHDPYLLQHRQSFFLFREAAGTMTTVAMNKCLPLAQHALATLKRLLRSTTGTSHRAAAEAAGALPVRINSSFPPPGGKPEIIPCICFGEIAGKCENISRDKAVFIGRSLTFPFAFGKKILVIKLARRQESADGLFGEALWMNSLRKHFSSLTARFNIPHPLQCHDSFVYRIKDLPIAPPRSLNIHPETIAIAFAAHREYFAYANEPQHYRDFSEVKEVMARNGWLLGYLVSHGNLHTAPIPLFHNRVQSERREDNGLYDWPLGGRLDQWLASCRHPNFGLSGIRDFEHFEMLDLSGGKLYWNLGAHILSLLLVSASYFRNHDKKVQGLSLDGRPVDARHLFSKNHLIELITVTLGSYYKGFVGHFFTGAMPFDVNDLADRIIEEMGVDRHMDEILRQVDQRRMSDTQFAQFLMKRGFSDRQASMAPKGKQDIVLHTGPHLGGFNQSISIPELITATASMAATCVLDRYALEN